VHGCKDGRNIREINPERISMNQDAYAKTLEWLKTNPSMDELCAKFPDEWAAVQQDI